MAGHQSFPHVLILGGGLGGLLLAQSLRNQGISFEVFEKDPSLHARNQGWAIGLHTFLDDLSSQVPDDLPPIDITNHLLPLDLPAQACIYPPQGPRLYVQSSPAHKIIRANRPRLHDWLATKIDIQFGKHTTAITETDNKVHLQFSDGTSAVGDILIGADGVHSQVRAHLLNDPHHKLLQAVPEGVIVSETTVDKSSLDRQLELGHSAYICLGKDFHTFVGLQSVAPDGQSARFYWFVIWDDANQGKPDFWTKTASKQELYQFALQEEAGFDPKFTEIMRLTDAEGVILPPLVIHDLVLKFNQMPKGRRIALLGDAAHPMTPFRGEGGCHAMIDALKLGKVIGERGPEDIVEGLEEYTQEMLKRGNEAVLKSRTANEEKSSERMVWGAHVQRA